MLPWCRHDAAAVWGAGVDVKRRIPCRLPASTPLGWKAARPVQGQPGSWQHIEEDQGGYFKGCVHAADTKRCLFGLGPLKLTPDHDSVWEWGCLVLETFPDPMGVFCTVLQSFINC